MITSSQRLLRNLRLLGIFVSQKAYFVKLPIFGFNEATRNVSTMLYLPHIGNSKIVTFKKIPQSKNIILLTIIPFVLNPI